MYIEPYKAYSVGIARYVMYKSKEKRQCELPLLPQL